MFQYSEAVLFTNCYSIVRVTVYMYVGCLLLVYIWKLIFAADSHIEKTKLSYGCVVCCLLYWRCVYSLIHCSAAQDAWC